MEKNKTSEFEGVFCRGVGEIEFLKMLDDCWKTIDGPGQNLMMCYSKELDSFYEGPDWKGVWTQNTYGMYIWTSLLPDKQFGMLDRAYNVWFAYHEEYMKNMKNTKRVQKKNKRIKRIQKEYRDGLLISLTFEIGHIKICVKTRDSCLCSLIR